MNTMTVKKLLLNLIFIPLWLSLTIVGFSQITISGKVIDSATKVALANVNIQEKGTNNIVVSNKSGAYKIVVKSNQSVLLFSYVGKRNIEMSASANNFEKIILSDDAYFFIPEIVVTGTFNPSIRLNSSISLTTANREQIELRVPVRGVGDFLKTVPGFQINSEYGEIYNNYSVRGLLKYISFKEDGLPVLEVPDDFGNPADGLVRIDETVRKVEALRGGSTALFTSNNPGAIINFISKTGDSLKQYGSTKFTYGTQQLYRIDMNTGGPLAKNWQYNMGGFYRYDVGVKPTGSTAFPNNNGGQLKLNITRYFNNKKGYFRFYGKYLNDRNLVFSGVPIKNVIDKTPQQITNGPDLSSGSLYGSNDRYVTLRNPYQSNPNVLMTKDMADGIFNRYLSGGVELNKDFNGGWDLSVRSKYFIANNISNQIAGSTSPYPDSLPLSFNDALRPLVGFKSSPSTPLFSYPPIQVQLRDVASGNKYINNSTLNGNGLLYATISAFGESVTKDLMSELQLSKKIGTHAITLGAYSSYYTLDYKLTQALIFHDVSTNLRRIAIDTTRPIVFLPIPAFDPIRAVLPLVRPFLTGDGIVKGVGAYVNSTNKNNVFAFFAGDSWQPSNRVNVEYGFRYDFSSYQGKAERPTNTLVNQVGSGIYRNWKYNFSNWGGSLGINLKLNNQSAIYARASRGTHTPTSAQWIASVDNNNLATGNTINGTVEEVFQGEMGFKQTTNKISVFANLFYSTAKNINNLLFVNNGVGVVLQQIPVSTKTIGAEMEMIYTPIQYLQLRGMLTLQDPRWADFAYTNTIYRGGFAADTTYSRNYKNNLIAGVSRATADFVISYTPYQGFGGFANIRYKSKYAINNANVYSIDPGLEVLAGISYSYKRVELAVRATNLLNTQRIQNAAQRIEEQIVGVDKKTRTFQQISPTTGRVEIASPYVNATGALPRSILFSIGYRF
jgi:iron complex outermembrane recepter protein